MGILNAKYETLDQLIWHCDCGDRDYVRVMLDHEEVAGRVMWMEDGYHVRRWFGKWGRLRLIWGIVRGRPHSEHYVILNAEVVTGLRAALAPFDVANGAEWNASGNAIQ